MTTKNRLLATLVGFVVFFLLGWLVYGMLLMDFYANNAGSATGVMRAEDEMIWWALILGNLFQTYLLVYIFGNWANITTFSDGDVMESVNGTLNFGSSKLGNASRAPSGSNCVTI